MSLYYYRLMTTMLKITYIRSVSGHPQVQRKTLEALGLRKLQSAVRKPDNPCIRGMIKKIVHLVEVEEMEEVEG